MFEINIIKNPPDISLSKFRKFWDEHKDHTDMNRNERDLNFFDDPKYIITGSINDQLVSMLFIHIRSIRYANKTYRLGGLGAVVTHKQYRNIGYSTELLKKALNFMKRTNVDLVLLCTDLDKRGSFYQRVGFVPLGRAYFFKNKKGEIKSDTDGMIAPVNSKSIIQKILNSDEKLFIGESNF